MIYILTCSYHRKNYRYKVTRYSLIVINHKIPKIKYPQPINSECNSSQLISFLLPRCTFHFTQFILLQPTISLHFLSNAIIVSSYGSTLHLANVSAFQLLHIISCNNCNMHKPPQNGVFHKLIQMGRTHRTPSNHRRH